MATPAAVLSILVKAQGVQAASAQLGTLDKNARKAGAGIETAEKHAKRGSATLAKLGMVAKVGAAAGFAGLAVGVKSAVTEFREAQKVGAQTSAVLKSTGNAAKTTKKHIEDLAGAISLKSGIDDEAIQTGANLLLTFKDIRNETGKGNKIFDQATQVITDMSVAMNQGLKPSAIQVGKALNDPVKGMTALSRVGVTFTEGQKKQVAALVASGDKLGAQKIILKELKSEFQGSAAAQATAGDKLKVAWGNLAEAAGGVLVPMLDKVATFMTKVINQFVKGEGIAKFIVPAFNEIKRAVTDLVTVVQILIPIVGPTLTSVFNTLRDAFNGLPAPIKGVTVALAALGVVLVVSSPLMAGLVALAAGALVVKRNWSTIAPIIQHVRDTVTNWVAKNRADIDVVIKAFNDVANVTRAVFQVAFPVVFGIAKRQIEALKTVISGQLEIIKGALNVFLGLLHGDWSRVWGGLKDIAAGGMKAAWGAVKAQTAPFREVGTRITAAIVDGLAGLGHMILQRFKEAADFVKDKITGLFSGVGGLIGKGVGKIPGIGDGIGKTPSAGKGSAALMGARSSLAPFANIGAGFGLHVSSGLRPGAFTSSGNPSYHSSGEAIDMAGDPRGMIGFFNAMKSKYGGRLAELIYGPGKVGIKNGQPYNFGSALNAQHMDHVHVAFDTGKPGVGDGVGRLRGAMMGDGYGKSQLQSLWVKAGGSAATANMAAAIALAESGGQSTASHRNTDGSIDRGLWEINSTHGALSTFSPLGNARAAVKISSGGRNWNPWTVFKTGAYKKFLGSAAAAKKAVTNAKKKPYVSPKSKVAANTLASHGSLGLSDYQNDERLRDMQHAQDNRIAAAGGDFGGGGDAGDGGDGSQALQDSIDKLTAELTQTNAKLELQTQLAQDTLKKYNVGQSDYGVLSKALASIVSGEIGGRTGLGFMSPGWAGGGSRY